MFFSEMFDCVQIIAHTPPLAYMLLSAGLKDPERNEVDRLVQIIVATLLKPRVDEVQEKAFFMDKVLYLLPEKYRTYKQECAHEFLVHLFQLIDADVASKWTYSPLGILELDLNVTHKCGNSSCCFQRNDRTDKYTTISLGLPRMENGTLLKSYSLQDILNNFFTSCEQVQGSDRLCSECQTTQPSHEQMSLSSTGTVLVVHLKMFDKKRKISVPVITDQTLSLVQLCETDDMQSSRTVEYELTGIVYHTGKSGNSGHYTARFKTCKGWYEANDERMYGVDGPFFKPYDGSAQTKSTIVPYLVIYTRKGQVPDAINSMLSTMALTFPSFPLEDSR